MITIQYTEDHMIWVHGENDQGIEIPIDYSDLTNTMLLALDAYLDKYPQG